MSAGMPMGPLPDLLLERYLADDLGPEERRRVEQARDTSTEVRRRLEALARERRDFYDAQPPPAFARQVAQRLQRAPAARSPHRPRWGWVLAPSLAAATGLVVAVTYSHVAENAAPPLSASAALEAKPANPTTKRASSPKLSSEAGSAALRRPGGPLPGALDIGGAGGPQPSTGGGLQAFRPSGRVQPPPSGAGPAEVGAKEVFSQAKKQRAAARGRAPTRSRRKAEISRHAEYAAPPPSPAAAGKSRRAPEPAPVAPTANAEPPATRPSAGAAALERGSAAPTAPRRLAAESVAAPSSARSARRAAARPQALAAPAAPPPVAAPAAAASPSRGGAAVAPRSRAAARPTPAPRRQEKRAAAAAAAPLRTAAVQLTVRSRGRTVRPASSITPGAPLQLTVTVPRPAHLRLVAVVGGAIIELTPPSPSGVLVRPGRPLRLHSAVPAAASKSTMRLYVLAAAAPWPLDLPALRTALRAAGNAAPRRLPLAVAQRSVLLRVTSPARRGAAP